MLNSLIEIIRRRYSRGPGACPLSGGPNGCGMSRDLKRTAWVCWCAKERFPAALLDRIPAEARMKSCVCPECVRRIRNEAGASSAGRTPPQT